MATKVVLLIEGGTAIDVLRGVAEQSDWAVLDSGRLVQCEATSPLAISNRHATLAANGLYLVPGLIDAHVHLNRPRQPATSNSERRSVPAHIARFAAQTARGGVTLVRDLGDRLPFGAKAFEAAKELDAPRVVSALAGLTVPNGYGLFLGEAVRDTAGLLAAVHRRHEAGARVIKLFLTDGIDFAAGTVRSVQFDLQTVATAARAAHDLGMTVAVHANGSEAVLEAVRAGVDTIEHGILADDNALRAMVEHGVYWVPTLTPLWRALTTEEGVSGCDTKKDIALRRVFEQHQRSVVRAFDLGVKVVAGTDAGSPKVPHGCLADELALFVAAGVPPAPALRAATIWAAEALGVGAEAGMIATGRWADLLVLRRDPVKDISALKEISHVICGGKILATAGRQEPVSVSE